MAPIIIELIGTGILFGIIHVLTGPDHLSALSTLSANIGNYKAFTLGIRWGIGHSTGLVIVAVILISLSQDDNIDVPPLLSTILESLVGVFMILLGLYGIYRSIQKRSNENNSNDEAVDKSSFLAFNDGDEISREVAFVQERKKIEDAVNDKDHDSNSHAHSQTHDESNLEQGDLNRQLKHDPNHTQPQPNKFIAFLIGIVHGVAGPGGILGVIPAVELKVWYLSTIYLGCFCISSTLTMGIFAALYGTCSAGVSSKTNFEFQVNIFSASLSIIVGILWIVLLSLGILDDWFP